MTSPKQLVENRPAESATGLAAAIVVIVAYLFNITDPVVFGSLIVIVGAIPAIITWIVNVIRGAR